MAEDNDIAKWLAGNPERAQSFQASIRKMFDQVLSAESAMEAYQRRMRETAEQLHESLKAATRMPKINVDSFLSLRDQLDAVFPKNWPRPIPSTTAIEEVLEIDGIPIVHIPRAEIVQAIVDAEDYGARIAVIETRADDIAEDCRIALDRDFHSGLNKQMPLARSAVAAYQDGHYEAAQALAVSVCDTYFKKLFEGESYTEMQKLARIEEAGDAPVGYVFNFHYSLAPAVPFLTPFYPSKGDEPPTKLSRHVTIHFAGTDHMTKLNSTVAIMLVTGLTVGIDWAMKRADAFRKKDEGK